MESNSTISFEKLRDLAEGKLSEKESEHLFVLLEKDEESRAIYEGLVSFLENESITIDDFIKKNQDQIFKPKKKRVSRRVVLYSMIAVAASIIAYIFILPNRQDYSKFDFQDAGLPVTLNAKSSRLNESMNAYKLGNFDRSDSLISSLLVNDNNNDTLLYYKAVNQKELGNYDSAANYFDQINSKSEFFEKAEYQLAMCNICLDNTDKAKQVLKGISEKQSHYFQKQATQLLSKINE